MSHILPRSLARSACALAFVGGLGLTAFTTFYTTEAHAQVADADALLNSHKNADDCQKALDIYEQELARDPESLDLKLKIAKSLNLIMRIRTNNNTILIEGASDTPANKKIWQKYSSDAYKYAAEVYKAKPNDRDALAVYAESYMYYSVSIGILEAISKGSADEFKRNAQKLIDKYPSYDSGAGYIYLAGFYAVAPWPLSDLDKAADYANKALKVDGSSRRNLYYAGVIAYRQSRYADAAAHFEKATKASCNSDAEKDICSFLLRESKNALQKAQEKQ